MHHELLLMLLKQMLLYLLLDCGLVDLMLLLLIGDTYKW